ncbi:TonB-dependent receptor plug domain-containing protein [Hymenobacter cheonanensis]|uniref:TonB-dependent receptor plug domain-containing protein n=1 Tax=Hymenobacter sp. CA2-7 TaxID=3063993 RepID=UPI00272AE0B2|nr:TonB-dependent receptor plug domain-containing protein [Hymenobacter sp. CA2-7]
MAPPAGAQTAPATGLTIQDSAKAWPNSRRITLDGPRPSGLRSVIYLDGRRLDSTRLASLNPGDIASIEVLKAPVARQLGPDEARLGVLAITTKAGQHGRAVRRFGRRLARLKRGPAAGPAAR